MWSIYSILIYIILYLLSFNYFSHLWFKLLRNSCKITNSNAGHLSWDPGTPCGHTPPSCNAEGNVLRKFWKIDQAHRTKNSHLVENTVIHGWFRYSEKCFLNLGEIYWNILISGVDLLANVSDFSVSWRWISHGNSPPWNSRDYSQVQQLATEVWFPCSKYNFVEALCPLLIIFGLKVDLKNVNIIETWKRRHFISSIRIANLPTSRGLQKLLAIRKRKANILAHRTRLLVLCHTS